jgi:hypothetical protein
VTRGSPRPAGSRVTTLLHALGLNDWRRLGSTGRPLSFDQGVSTFSPGTFIGCFTLHTLHAHGKPSADGRFGAHRGGDSLEEGDVGRGRPVELVINFDNASGASADGPPRWCMAFIIATWPARHRLLQSAAQHRSAAAGPALVARAPNSYSYACVHYIRYSLPSWRTFKYTHAPRRLPRPALSPRTRRRRPEPHSHELGGGAAREGRGRL